MCTISIIGLVQNQSRCRHCDKLLTVEQQSLLPCNVKRFVIAAVTGWWCIEIFLCPIRLAVDRHGGVVFNHERTESWNINHYLQSLQKQEGLTIRDIYWRLWGLVNSLQCQRCNCTFQCSDLPLCPYHPHLEMVTPTLSGDHLATPRHSCCQRPVLGFSTLPHMQV